MRIRSAAAHDGLPAASHDDLVVSMFIDYTLRRGHAAAMAAARGGAFGQLSQPLLTVLDQVALDMDAAVRAERRRIADLEAHALPGHEELLAEAKSSGMSPDDFKVRQRAKRREA